MRKLIPGVLAMCAVVGTANTVEAVPVLQLDIVGGYYDQSSETTVSTGPSFTLVALLSPKPGQNAAALAETYFISVALTPQTGAADQSLGSFSWNGSSYDVTDDMIYGTPPLEGLHTDPDAAEHDGGDLGQHSVFPTFFREFEFTFNPAQMLPTYNTAEPDDPTTGFSYYQTFAIDMNLPAGFQMHFDLYNSEIRTKCSGRPRTCLTDEDIDKFAPFSHDAESGNPPPVPEPASMTLLGAGLAAGAWRRRQAAKKK